MTQIKFKTTLLLLCGWLMLETACKKPYDYDKEITPSVATPEKIAASLHGKWQMRTGLQVDEKSLVKESIDITEFLVSGGNTPNITFNADQTFTVDTARLLVNYFSTDHGNWTFDDARYPTKVLLTDVSGNPLTEISIGSNLIGLSPQLSYISSVGCGETKALSYNITLIKQ